MAVHKTPWREMESCLLKVPIVKQTMKATKSLRSSSCMVSELWVPLELRQAQVQVLSELQDKFKPSNLVRLSLKIQSKKTVDVI